jgi:hypothetical protein
MPLGVSCGGPILVEHDAYMIQLEINNLRCLTVKYCMLSMHCRIPSKHIEKMDTKEHSTNERGMRRSDYLTLEESHKLLNRKRNNSNNNNDNEDEPPAKR